MKININKIGSSIVFLNIGDEIVDDSGIVVGMVVSDAEFDYSDHYNSPCKLCLFKDENCSIIRCNDVYVKKSNNDTTKESKSKLIDMNYAVNRICNSDVCPFYESGCINEGMLYNGIDSCIINILFKE